MSMELPVEIPNADADKNVKQKTNSLQIEIRNEKEHGDSNQGRRTLESNGSKEDTANSPRDESPTNDSVKSKEPRKLTRSGSISPRLSLSDITFANRPTTIQLNVDALSEDELRSKTLQLEHEWVFWYDDRRSQSKSMTTEDYENSMKNCGKFHTIQDFWKYFNNLQDPKDLSDGTNIRMFKSGIKPTWEDPANEKGGKWVIQTSKDSTYQIWFKILLAIIGEQFEFSDQICGVVVSVRNKGDTINVWNKTSTNETEINVTINDLKKITGFNQIKYLPHSQGLAPTEKSGIYRSHSNPQIRVKEVEIHGNPEEINGHAEDVTKNKNKRRNSKQHKKSFSISESADEDSEETPNGRKLTSSLSFDGTSMDLRRNGEIASPVNITRKSSDLPPLPKKEIAKHVRSPSNSSTDENKQSHKRSPSQSTEPTTMHKRIPSIEISTPKEDAIVPANKQEPVTPGEKETAVRHRKTPSGDSRNFKEISGRKPNGLPPPYPKKQTPPARVRTSSDWADSIPDSPTATPDCTTDANSKDGNSSQPSQPSTPIGQQQQTLQAQPAAQKKHKKKNSQEISVKIEAGNSTEKNLLYNYIYIFMAFLGIFLCAFVYHRLVRW